MDNIKNSIINVKESISDKINTVLKNQKYTKVIIGDNDYTIFVKMNKHQRYVLTNGFTKSEITLQEFEQSLNDKIETIGHNNGPIRKMIKKHKKLY